MSNEKSGRNNTTLSILSLNCQRSPEVIHALTSDNRLADKWDIICLQEPPRNVERSQYFRTTRWSPLYPTKKPNEREPSRAIMLVNNHIPPSAYRQHMLDSRDLIAITLDQADITIYSVYNPPDSNETITTLHEVMANDEGKTILAGDFNKHHALWSGNQAPARNRRSDTESLIELMAEHNLSSCLPVGTPTRYSTQAGTWTTIDLFFITEELNEKIVKCTSRPDDGYGSDHCSVELILDLSIPTTRAQPRPNYKATNWEEYREKAESLFASKPVVTPIQDRDDINRAVARITENLQEALAATTPMSRPSKYAKRWWDASLDQHKEELRKARRQLARTPRDERARNNVVETRNRFHSAIRRQKRRHWKEFVEEATEKTVWLASKYATETPTTTTTTNLPPLKTPTGVATTNEEKQNVLLPTFFPPTPEVDLSDTDDYEYPTPLDDIEISVEEIQTTIDSLPAYKAPGPSGIINMAIKQAAQHVVEPLADITNAGLRLGYFPDQWKNFITITLRKPGKDDYSIPKAYRPIALQETLGKTVEATIAKRLTLLAEQNGLLPDNHFGGRPGRTPIDPVLLTTQMIKDSWRNGEVTSVLYLDISQAFPTVSHPRLIHNLRKRKVPQNIINIIEDFLSGRTTVLKFDDHISHRLAASNGIPQGSPLSVILYLFFSSDILEITDATRDWRRIRSTEMSAGFVDDTVMAVSGPTFEDNTRRLEEIGRKVIRWSATHGCQCDIKKFQIVHFTRNKAKRSNLALKIGEVVIEATESAKYLGIVMDSQLRWKQHVEKAIAKGTSTLLAISRLSRPTFGLPHHYMRQLFMGVVLPKVEYGLITWYEPVREQEDRSRRKGSVGTANRLAKLQRQATIRITGGFKTTATTVLDYHADMEPTVLRLNQTAFKEAARLRTLPARHPLRRHVERCTKVYPRYHRTAIHELLDAFPILTSEVEVIDPGLADYSWKAPYSTRIAQSKQEAMDELHLNYGQHVQVFSDGSRGEDGVGAAAIHREAQGRVTTRRQYIGDAREHTALEGEIVGIALAADIIQEIMQQHPETTGITILTDSQAAVRAMAYKKRGSGQQITEEAHQALGRIVDEHPHLNLTVAWIPAHSNIKGNEDANREAKLAAQGQSTRSPYQIRGPLKRLPTNLLAIKAEYKSGSRERWAQEWRECAQYKKLAKFDRSPPSERTKKFYKKRNRRDGSLITQLRSGHIGLNAYLSKIKVVDSPLCQRCQAPETVTHFLLQCRRYSQERARLRAELPKNKELTLTTLLGDPANIGHTLDYVHATNRLPCYNNPDDTKTQRHKDSDTSIS